MNDSNKDNAQEGVVSINESFNNRQATIGFCLGIVSIFFEWIGLIPLIGLYFSVMGAYKAYKNNWIGIRLSSVGIFLNYAFSFGVFAVKHENEVLALLAALLFFSAVIVVYYFTVIKSTSEQMEELENVLLKTHKYVQEGEPELSTVQYKKAKKLFRWFEKKNYDEVTVTAYLLKRGKLNDFIEENMFSTTWSFSGQEDEFIESFKNAVQNKVDAIKEDDPLLDN